MVKNAGLIVLMLFVNACAHEPIFVQDACLTACGMRMYGSKDCQGFQKAEDKAVGVYDYYLKSSSTCNRLNGVVVEVESGKQWLNHDGVKDGLTFCREKKIKLGTDNWPMSVLAEELLHIVECRGYIANKDPHENWENSWQREAIRRAQ